VLRGGGAEARTDASAGWLVLEHGEVIAGRVAEARPLDRGRCGHGHAVGAETSVVVVSSAAAGAGRLDCGGDEFVDARRYQVNLQHNACGQWRFHAGDGGTQAPKSWLPPPPNLAVLLTHSGQLILRKNSKFDATRCQILRLTQNSAQNSISAPDRAGRAYIVPPESLAVFKGAYF